MSNMDTTARDPASSMVLSSLPLPSPKAPPGPGYLDLYGKRREMARVQMIEREISFLEEELKSSEGFQPASKCCKEVDDFVMERPDPLLPTSKKNRRSRRFWKWLCRMRCFNLSWICCWCCDCWSGNPKFSSCSCSSCLPSINCYFPKWNCCCKETRGCGCNKCCILPSCNFGWPFPSCCICKCSCSCTCPKFPKVRPCGYCTIC